MCTQYQPRIRLREWKPDSRKSPLYREVTLDVDRQKTVLCSRLVLCSFPYVFVVLARVVTEAGDMAT